LRLYQILITNFLKSRDLIYIPIWIYIIYRDNNSKAKIEISQSFAAFTNFEEKL